MNRLPHPGLVQKALDCTLASYGRKTLPLGAEWIEDRYYDARAYFIPCGDCDVIAFTGSESVRDWTLNVQAVPWRYHGHWCHLGFIRAHKSVWPALRTLLTPGRPVLVTGHSLGGALAELSCIFLAEHDAPVHLVTFGKPNVFFQPVASKFEYLASQLSVVSGSDLVARIPRILYGPDPGQHILYLANDGNDYLNPCAAFRRHDWSAFDAVSDHSIELYATRLAALLTVELEAGRCASAICC